MFDKLMSTIPSHDQNIINPIGRLGGVIREFHFVPHGTIDLNKPILPPLHMS